MRGCFPSNKYEDLLKKTRPGERSVIIYCPIFVSIFFVFVLCPLLYVAMFIRLFYLVGVCWCNTPSYQVILSVYNHGIVTCIVVVSSDHLSCPGICWIRPTVLLAEIQLLIASNLLLFAELGFQVRPYGNIQDHMGPYRTIQDHKGP